MSVNEAWRIDLPARFWSKVDKTESCWRWTGAKSGSGYGYIATAPRPHQAMARAHRISWLLSGRDIPENMVLDHLCRVRDCVNPEHLEVTTFKENILRGEGYFARAARVRRVKNGFVA